MSGMWGHTVCTNTCIHTEYSKTYGPHECTCRLFVDFGTASTPQASRPLFIPSIPTCTQTYTPIFASYQYFHTLLFTSISFFSFPYSSKWIYMHSFFHAFYDSSQSFLFNRCFSSRWAAAMFCFSPRKRMAVFHDN